MAAPIPSPCSTSSTSARTVPSASAHNPTGLAVNPVRNEVYVVNTESGTVSVIDTESNRVVATIPVHRQPYFISVDNTGRRAYVANSGSNNVSVIDLDQRARSPSPAPASSPASPASRPTTAPSSSPTAAAAASPSTASPPTTSPRTAAPAHILRFRDAFSGCPGATDAVILPDSSKAFIACSAGHQVMAINLAADPASWAAKQAPALMTDHLLTLLDVGEAPVNLAMKPDGGEIFVSNFDADSISEISTWTNEVGWTQAIGNKPSHALVSRDNSTLWVSNFGADSISLYSIDDGRVSNSVHTGSGPDALAFSADEHLLLAADAHSGDVSILRTQDKTGPTLFTILPAGSSPNAIVTKAFRLKS